MNKKWISAGIVAAFFGFQSACQADVMTFGASSFNTIFQSTDTGNQIADGASQFIFAGDTDDGPTRRGLLQFDLSSIPAGATITSATLTMYADRSQPASGSQPISIYRMTTGWGQGTSDGDGSATGSAPGGGSGGHATANDATWLYTFYNPANPTASPAWTNQGGDGNYLSTASASTIIAAVSGTPTAYTWSGSAVTADVQAWVANSSANFGWMLQGDETVNDSAIRFESPLNSNSGAGTTLNARPYLPVTYSVPEPASMLVISVCGVALMARRRRRRA
jgi:hypothetical protein